MTQRITKKMVKKEIEKLNKHLNLNIDLFKAYNQYQLVRKYRIDQFDPKSLAIDPLTPFLSLKQIYNIVKTMNKILDIYFDIMLGDLKPKN